MSRSSFAVVRDGLLGLALSWTISPTVFAQPPAEKPARPVEAIAAGGQSGKVGPNALTPGVSVRASATVEGTASPGLKMTLNGSASSGSQGNRTWYRWLQTQGPRTTIDDPTRPEAHFLVPADAKVLGFVLVVGDKTGIDAQAVLIEVEDPEISSGNAMLKADAGDQQPGKVGRRVVLNGIRSEPKGRIKFRWIQASGPKAGLNTTDGPTCSFVPTVPGSYQFALVVATSEGILSEASMVTIEVAGAGRASSLGTESRTMAIDELARVSLASIDGGPRLADDLSRAFDAVADRMDGFKNYKEAIEETTRRLDGVVPRDKDRRAVWSEQLFNPVMTQVNVGMRTEGLDLNRPESQLQAMTKPQKARLAEQFRYTAAGLRASKTLR